jgi:hypothetical protein
MDALACLCATLVVFWFRFDSCLPCNSVGSLRHRLCCATFCRWTIAISQILALYRVSVNDQYYCASPIFLLQQAHFGLLLCDVAGRIWARSTTKFNEKEIGNSQNLLIIISQQPSCAARWHVVSDAWHCDL